MNFYMELSSDVLEDAGAYMQFTLPGANHTEEKVYLKDVDKVTIDEKDYYVFSCGVAAKDMASEIKAQFNLSDGTQSEEYSYTIRQYADYIIEHPDSYSEEAIAMMKAMMNYGGYAQEYFTYNMDNLANKDLDTTLADVILGDEYEYSVTGSVDGLTYAGTTLMFTTVTGICHYFTLDEGKDIEDYTFQYAGNTLTPVESGDYYYVEIENISAKNLKDMYTLSINDECTLEYSPYTYMKTIIEGNYADSAKNVAKAMYYYCEAADAYFTSIQN